MEQRVVTCVYCGHEYPPGTPTSGSQVEALTAHIRVCEKHPMQALVKEHEALKEKAGVLASKVIWALKYLDCKGSGCMIRENEDGTKMIFVSWIDDFIEALASVGLVVKKEDVMNIRNPPKKRSKRTIRKQDKLE